MSTTRRNTLRQAMTMDIRAMIILSHQKSIMTNTTSNPTSRILFMMSRSMTSHNILRTSNSTMMMDMIKDLFCNRTTHMDPTRKPSRQIWRTKRPILRRVPLQ